MSSRHVLGVRITGGKIVLLIVVPFLLAGLVWLVVRGVDWHASLLLLWMLAMLLVVSVLLILPLGERYEMDGTITPSGQKPSSERAFARMMLWESALATVSDPDQFNNRLRPRIAQVAAERLRARHGIDLDTEPQRAESVLGRPLYTMLTQPATERMDRRHLEFMIHRIEEI